MSSINHKINNFCLVTDFVANGSFASLRENVEYLKEEGYAVLVRTTDGTKKWNGNYVWVDKHSFDFLKKSTLYPGDLIMANVGEPGKTFIVPDLKKPMTLGPNSILIRPDTKLAVTKYLYYYFNSQDGKKSIDSITSATSQSKFNKGSFRNLQIPLPSLGTQKRITEILDKADTLRKKNLELLKHYSALAQSIFIDIFGDPVKNDKGWEIRNLSELGKLDRGVSKHRPRNAPELIGGNYPLVQTGDIANSGGIINSFKSTYSELGLKQSKLWPKGTLCITIAANIAKTGILNFSACFPDSVVGFVPNNLSNNNFVQFIFQFLQKILEDAAPESAQKNINLEILRNLKVIAPPIELQNQFAMQIQNIELQKEKVKAQIKASENLFQSLLQKAFNDGLKE